MQTKLTLLLDDAVIAKAKARPRSTWPVSRATRCSKS